MSIFVLFIIAVINGQPVADYRGFGSMEACQKAQAEVTQALVTSHVERGSVTCTEHKVGTFS